VQIGTDGGGKMTGAALGVEGKLMYIEGQMNGKEEKGKE
jgi:hypothetical protein